MSAVVLLPGSQSGGIGDPLPSRQSGMSAGISLIRGSAERHRGSAVAEMTGVKQCGRSLGRRE